MLVMKDVSKVFRTAMVETHAVRDLTLHVRPGEFVAVTGPSGSGKTTFLNIAGLLEELTGGDYLLDGVNVKQLDDRARSRLRNEKIGFIFQSFNLIPDLDLFDNVDVPLRYRRLTRGERKTRIEHALERVGLASRMRHFPAELSGGQQQRVAIARAIAGEPKLLLADEPTGNLDSRTSIEIMGIFQQLNEQGMTVIMVTHELDIARYCRRVVVMRDGLIRSDEAAKDRFRANEELAKLDAEQKAVQLTA